MNHYQLKNLTLACLMAVTSVFSSCEEDKITNEPANATTGTVSKYQALKSASSYSIPVGTITDHSDATAVGSIAWYLATYGGGTAASPNTFYLSSNAVYTCQRTITLPAYARISEGAGITTAVIQCDPINWQSAAGYNKLVRMYAGSILLHVELRLNWKAAIGVFASWSNGVQIIDVTVSNSAKTSTETSYLIYVSNSDSVLIDNCLLRRAGCENTETGFSRRSYLVHIIGGTGINVTNNDMSTSASSGIAFVQTTHLNIENNIIQDTGRSNVPDYVADGITSYHGGQGTLNRVVFIKNNTIKWSKNHGIHVSGYGISITGNNISGSEESNIYLGDQRTPPDCSADIWVTGNTLGAQTNAAYSIYRNHVISSRIYISNNTGSTSVQPAIACL